MRRVKLPAVVLALALCAASSFAQPRNGEPSEKGGEETPQERIVARIFRCVAEGLPQDWKRAWIEIRELERTRYATVRRYEASFRVATSEEDRTGEPLVPCGAEEIVEGVTELNAFLPEAQRRWTGATFAFFRDGRFEVTYDYSSPGTVLEPELPPPGDGKPDREKPAARKPAAKPKPAATTR
ncbi:MAG: hypothetical protein RML56_00400 [Burkholderiales bacterium]|nr:hypothetical protein [Burkholderiales bacterium]